MSAVDAITKKFTFPFPPRPFQRREIDLRIEDCVDKIGLYWGIGAGKTFGSTLATLVRRDRIGSQTLLVVPPILILQWKRWLEKIPGIKVKVYYGTPKQRKDVTFDRDTHYFITSMVVFKRDFDRLCSEFHGRPYTLVVDEATAIKNVESDNYRATLQFSVGQGIQLLTGTPLSTPKDAYAYIKLLAPGTYRTLQHFENIHVAEREFIGGIKSWRELDLLHENMKIHSSKVLTAEVVEDLPQAIMVDVPYELERKHKKLYETLAEQQLLVYEDGTLIDASTPQKMYTMIQQIVMNYAHFAREPGARSTGFDVLDETLQELGDTGKLVVFANYKMTITSIMLYLASQGIGAVQINGDVSNAQKFANIDTFIEDPKCRVVVMNPISGGVGVDGLQHVCTCALFLELPLIPWHFTQAVGRLERTGQSAPPVIKIATAQGTVQVTLQQDLLKKDQLVNKVHQSYRELRQAIFGGG